MDPFNFDNESKIENLHKQVELLFNIWSELPKGKKHKLDRESKIYQRVFSYVSNLRQGLPMLSVSRGSADLHYFQSLKLMVNTVSNKDKRILNLIHKKWKTKEIKSLLVKIGTQIEKSLPLDQVFWMPFIKYSLYSDKYAQTGFSYFSLYALNENTADQYNNFVNEFYNAPFAREVSDLTKQKEAIFLEEYVNAKKVSMDTLKKLLSWYFLARDDTYVRKVDTVTQFVKERARLEENRANLSKKRSSSNKNSYVSSNLREKLKSVKELEI